MIKRDDADELMQSKIKVVNLRKHIWAVEAGMRQLAEHFGEDVEKWGLVGLLHDLDYDQTAQKPEKHTFITEKWLEEYNLPEDMIYAIRCHPGHTPCKSKIDWSLYATDPASGFIVACALMHPKKSLEAVDREFMLRRFDEKRFAAGASRDNMRACSNLDLELGEFLDLIREAMLGIREKLEL